MKKICLFMLLQVAMYSLFAQLGAVQNFVFFSSRGAVSNTGSSAITGSIGANLGAVTGFKTGVYAATADTKQAQTDLLNLYIQLTTDTINTITTHPAVFGNGEILKAGVYNVPTAGSLVGKLTLIGSATDLFIFKFNGAFSSAAAAAINFTGVGKTTATASNVFFIAEGAVSIGAACTMNGTFIAHSGAASMGAGGILTGRLLSTDGAVSFGPGTASLPALTKTTITIPAYTTSSNTTILGTAASYTLFTSAGAVSNIGTSGFIGNIGTGAGAVTGFDAPSAIISGAIIPSVATATADLQKGYSTLVAKSTSAHAAVFGNGESLSAGVYKVGGAASVAGTLTLNGAPGSQFIFIIDGALAMGAQSHIILTGGATFSNVFWVAEGAISIGAFSTVKGYFIAHNGANTMGANCNLEGSLFSTAGAIGVNTGVAFISHLPIAAHTYGKPSYKIIESVILKNNLSVSKESKLSIYPNPARGVINLGLTGDASKVSAVEIVDVLGKMVYSSKHYQPIINLSNQSAGIYFVRVLVNSKITTTKVIMVK